MPESDSVLFKEEAPVRSLRSLFAREFCPCSKKTEDCPAEADRSHIEPVLGVGDVDLTRHGPLNPGDGAHSLRYVNIRQDKGC
jgi:hypothetical protein